VQSTVGAFDFPDELIFDIWGVVDDWKNDCLRGCTTNNPKAIS
jgi:hypothetical protein